MSLNLQTLAHEIEYDPTTLGYNPAYGLGAYDVVRDKLNEPKASAQMPRLLVDSDEILGVLAPGDFAASTNPVVGAWVGAVLDLDAIPVNVAAGTDTTILDGLQSLLTNPSTSLTNLTAVATRDGSRAETLFGVGTKICIQDILNSQRWKYAYATISGGTTIANPELLNHYMRAAEIAMSTTVSATLTVAVE